MYVAKHKVTFKKKKGLATEYFVSRRRDFSTMIEVVYFKLITSYIAMLLANYIRQSNMISVLEYEVLARWS